MQQADFIHLVRESEIACEQDKTAYQRSVMRFVALGYAWVLGLLLLALAMAGWAAWRLWADGYIRFMPMLVLISACGLLWVSLRALWSDESAIEGVSLSPQDAPGLFEALERIRKKIKGPPIDAVYLDAEFNASIQQRPRFGLLGGQYQYAHDWPATADGAGQGSPDGRVGPRIRPPAWRPRALLRLDLPHAQGLVQAAPQHAR